MTEVDARRDKFVDLGHPRTPDVPANRQSPQKYGISPIERGPWHSTRRAARPRVENAEEECRGVGTGYSARPYRSSLAQFFRPSFELCWQKPLRILNCLRPSVVAGDPTLSEVEISCRSANGSPDASGCPIASV